MKFKNKTIHSVFRNCTDNPSCLPQSSTLRLAYSRCLRNALGLSSSPYSVFSYLSALAPSSPPVPTHSPVSEHLCWARCPARCGERAQPSPPAIHGTVGRARQVARHCSVKKKSAGSMCQAAMGTEGRAYEHTDESSS